jgi:hypothetical protein
MKYQSLPIAASYRRFRALAGRLRNSVEDGQFQKMAATERLELIKKLRRLYIKLQKVIGGRRLQKALAAAALVLGLGLNTAQAQTFGAPQANPFGLNGAGETLIIPVTTDLDGDGDYDILATSYLDEQGPRVLFYENIGSAETPDFTTPVESPFGLVTPENLTLLTVGDLDGDGDLDILLGIYEDFGAGTDAIIYYENTGTPTAPSFANAIESPFGIMVTSGSPIPHLVDMDGDGDLDLMGMNYDEDTYEITFTYQENLGTITEPAFGELVFDPFGLPTDLEQIALYDLADMDGDGDLDMLYGNSEYLYIGETYRAFLSYVENIGTINAPVFGTPVEEPFGIEYPEDSLLPIPTIADLDDDGDLDVLSFVYFYDGQSYEGNGTFVYFENETPVSAAEVNQQLDWKVFPTLTRDQINLQIPNHSGEDLHLEIYSNTGQQLENQRIQNGSSEVSLAHLASGNYWLRLRTRDGQLFSTKQITKQ